MSDDLEARRGKVATQSREDMAGAARQMHALLVEYVKAGFTRREALHLVAAMFTAGQRSES